MESSDGSTMESRIVPLFPLPDLMLFPGQVLPLHVFEQRYRQMTRDLLDGSGELVLGTVLGEDKQSLAGVASVQPVAGLGRLEKYEKLPDGRYLVVVLGISRVWVEPIGGERIYPVCRIEDLPDEDPAENPELQMRLRHCILESAVLDELPVSTSTGQLADLLIMTTKMDVHQRYELFAINNVWDRGEKILAILRKMGRSTDPGKE